MSHQAAAPILTMVADVEAWRARQKPVPNLSEAIRRLVELGLKAKSRG